MFTLTGVVKSFAGKRALGPVDLDIAEGRTTVLIGPSGCGKSTLIRLMIGLVSADHGEIYFAGQRIGPDNAPALRRRMGYVIQDGGLFPHLSARGNVALMARHIGWPPGRIEDRLQALLALTDFPADGLGISRISDLRDHPGLRLGFGNEFIDRHDGWPGLKRRYRLPQAEVRGLDHDLAYRGLDAGSIDAMDVCTTDAEISYYGLRLLDDDLGYFPVYQAVIVYRRDLARRAPEVVAAFARLEGRIDEAAMAGMNAQVKLDREPEAEVAAAFLGATLGIAAAAERTGMIDRLIENTLAHLGLVAISLGAAIAVSVPLGIYAARRRRTGQVILAVTGIVQTIPSLALFVFMIPLLGIGGPPAIVALFLCSLLPIVRNTHAGFHDIAPSLIESADALGLSPGARLRLVELPLAARSILAGIKTTAVINVGTATLGALIGAGGYGQPILTGIRLDDTGLILEGAVPAAALALLVQGLFELAERACVAKGLRLKAEG